MSEDKNLTASSTPSVAIGYSRRTIALLMAAVISLAVLVSLLMSGGSGASTAYAVDTKTITVKALTDHDCDATEWHFVITQINSATNAPATITVTWANGDTEVVPLSKFTGGVAHYVTTSNLDSTVVSATAVHLHRMVGPIQPEPWSMWAVALALALGESHQLASHPSRTTVW